MVVLLLLPGALVYLASGLVRYRLSTGAAQIAALCAALVAYLVVNAGLLHIAIYLAMRPADLRSLFGSWADISLEIATLCLGAMTAIALLREPLLAVLVVPPMFVLQRSVLTRQLEIAATTDAKTGLLNAATWHHVAGVELARAERESYGAALLIIDMDNFKVINDTHGHLVGDDVLKAVADSLIEELRGYDSIGRFGGEEFVAVLSEVDELTALMISERIRQRITELEVASRTEGMPALTVAVLLDRGGLLSDARHRHRVAAARRRRRDVCGQARGRNRVELSAG